MARSWVFWRSAAAIFRSPPPLPTALADEAAGAVSPGIAAPSWRSAAGRAYTAKHALSIALNKTRYLEFVVKDRDALGGDDHMGHVLISFADLFGDEDAVITERTLHIRKWFRYVTRIAAFGGAALRRSLLTMPVAAAACGAMYGPPRSAAHTHATVALACRYPRVTSMGSLGCGLPTGWLGP